MQKAELVERTPRGGEERRQAASLSAGVFLFFEVDIVVFCLGRLAEELMESLFYGSFFVSGGDLRAKRE